LHIFAEQLSSSPKKINTMSDFKKIVSGKNGDYWEHLPTGLAAYFDRREVEYSTSENDSSDGMKGPSGNGFTGKMQWRSWSEGEVEKDFKTEQAMARTEFSPKPRWQKYTMVYHAGYREYQVKFEN
jgi:hypothetical protein